MTTYFVKNGGSDGASGLSDANAFATIGKLQSVLSGGDTGSLKRGSTWTGDSEGNPFDSLLEKSGSNITITAYGSGSKPILDRTNESDPVPDALNPDVTCIHITSGGNWTIEDIDFRAAGNTAAIFFQGSGGNVVRRCDFRGAGWDETINVTKASTTYEDCFYDLITGNTIGYRSAMEARSNNIIIRRCIARGITEGGVFRWANGATHGRLEDCYIFDEDNRDNWTFISAVVVRSQPGGGTFLCRNCVIDMTHGGQFGSPNSDPRFFSFWGDSGSATREVINCTMITDRGTTVASSNLAGNTTKFLNCIHIGMNLAHDGVANIGTAEFRNNIFHNVTTKYDATPEIQISDIEDDPLLTNENMTSRQAEDAKIASASSPAIDQSYTGDADVPTTDYGGNARSGTPDIGAWEFLGNDPILNKSSAISVTDSVTLSPDLIEMIASEVISITEFQDRFIDVLTFDGFTNIATSDLAIMDMQDVIVSKRVLIFPSPFV